MAYQSSAGISSVSNPSETFAIWWFAHYFSAAGFHKEHAQCTLTYFNYKHEIYKKLKTKRNCDYIHFTGA